MEREQLVKLVQAVQQGDQQAASDLYYNFYKDIYYYIFKTVNDQELAADLTQDTFMEILQTIDRLQEPAAFVTWSRQVAYHRCTAYFKKRHELLADEDEDGHSIFDDQVEERTEFIPDEALDKAELKQAVHQMLNDLPPDQRSAMLLRYFEERSVKEIAEIQGVSEGTVKSRLNYGRQSLKKAVESYEKRSGVKLRCVGIVPLLLWVFKGTKKASSALHTAKAAAEVADTVATVTQAADNLGNAAGVGGSVAKEVGKKAAKQLGVKAIAGITAGALTVGGGTAVVVSQLQKEDKPAYLNEWVGYTDKSLDLKHRCEITTEHMDKETIRGHLTVSQLYEGVFDTDFEGVAIETDEEETVYSITFEDAYNLGYGYRWEESELTYDRDRQEFHMDDHFGFYAQRTSTEAPQKLTVAPAWVCDGRYGFGTINNDFQSELLISQIDEASISGTMVLFREGSSPFRIEGSFTGRGYKDGAIYRYEIRWDVPTKSEDCPYELRQTFWLEYDKVGDLFQFGNALGYYHGTFSAKK